MFIQHADTTHKSKNSNKSKGVFKRNIRLALVKVSRGHVHPGRIIIQFTLTYKMNKENKKET